MDQPTGPACGNNPNYPITDGDRQAIADFRAYLDERAQAATAEAAAALAPLEAKARQLREQQRARHRAEVLRQAADAAEQTFINGVTPAASERDEIWDQAVRAVATMLRGLADEPARTEPKEA